MADRKLPFQVVFASGEDPEYACVELNFHSPQTKGWQSPRCVAWWELVNPLSGATRVQKCPAHATARAVPPTSASRPRRSFCEFPQELGLQFTDGLVNVSQVQLLSHQSKISTRIELFAGVGSDYFSCAFTRLGYLSLDSNARSAHKARELKSVYLKARGHFLKLVLHKCYVNSLNLYNQVGLIAINVLGTPGAARGGDGGALHIACRASCVQWQNCAVAERCSASCGARVGGIVRHFVARVSPQLCVSLAPPVTHAPPSSCCCSVDGGPRGRAPDGLPPARRHAGHRGRRWRPLRRPQRRDPAPRLRAVRGGVWRCASAEEAQQGDASPTSGVVLTRCGRVGGAQVQLRVCLLRGHTVPCICSRCMLHDYCATRLECCHHCHCSCSTRGA